MIFKSIYKVYAGFLVYPIQYELGQYPTKPACVSPEDSLHFSHHIIRPEITLLN